MKPHEVTITIMVVTGLCLCGFIATKSVLSSCAAPEIGEIYTYKNPDPFDSFEVKYEVIDVKDGYVQYYRSYKNGSGWSIPCIKSSSLSLFRIVELQNPEGGKDAS